ncbi:dynein light intermediate chain-domain-containing protein [Kockovaella imperatae]|uniref:Dynein light intermediate chain-domain-containing protein n=1 Tax=Kockovaella imperatae TaxID=4999 RepID=A0A1Y1UAN1_9TREE|nr:dynein light intermediate chain-domain-containing protein [Kockovaella imperatae]ORX35111.1 dynein light intermediate chain-domain-containing protein [Kockovaella imperatae]
MTAESSSTDIWSDILRSADRSTAGRDTYRRKNVIVLSEKKHGRRHLIDQLVEASGSSSRRKQRQKVAQPVKPSPVLAMGYNILEVKDEAGEEDIAPPISIFYPPSSHRSMLRLIPHSLPPSSFADTAVVIVLDWTRPSSMVKEIVMWLDWVERWASDSAARGQGEEMRDRLQSHIQHYSEPNPTASGPSTAAGPTTPSLPSLSSTYGSGPLLPLGPGTLILNSHGVPIIVVCTKADLMDNVAEEMGMKGAGWEERTDWIQQVLRTICLAYGAALFYTAPTQPQTYTNLRRYLLHRLYTIPPPLNPTSDTPLPTASSSRFPFSHRANVLDRDAIMVPTGWDSWGKINVLREGFDPDQVNKAWQVSLRRVRDGEEEGDDEEGLEDLWVGMIPDIESEPKRTDLHAITTTCEPEQTFLARQLDILQKDPNRDPRASFRQAAAAVSASAANAGSPSIAITQNTSESGVVGPMGAGGLNLPGVEKAMAEMEGGSADDLKERFAKLGRRESTRPGGPLSPTSPGNPGTTAVPNEALHNFFQGLLATKGKTSTSSTASTKLAPSPQVSAKSQNGDV